MDQEWQTFRAGLVWKPIADYDRESGEPTLLRAGSHEAFGYWGVGPIEEIDDPGARPTWRNAQESMDDARLPFDPEEWAEVDDEWRVHLMAD